MCAARVRRGRSRRRERPGGRSGGSTARRWRSGSPTGSRTGRCGCRDGLHWNMPQLFAETLDGLARAGRGGAARRHRRSTPGGSTTRCSTARGGCSGCRFTTATPRTEGMVARASQRVARPSSTPAPGSRRCRSTPSSSCWPSAERRPLGAAEHIALIPDLLGLWLTGELANEATIASTTGLLEARTGELGARPDRALGLPDCAVPGEPVEPGRAARFGAARARGARRTPVWNVASHDTASAFVGGSARGDRTRRSSPPERGRCSASRSTRPCSTAGRRVQPHQRARHRRHDPAAAQRHGPVADAGVPAPLGACGRLARLRRARAPSRAHRARSPLFDPDHPILLRRGDMPGADRAACARPPVSRAPAGPGRARASDPRCRWRASTASCSSGCSRHRPPRRASIHVIGGGARNALLCQLTADVTGLPVAGRPGRGDGAREHARAGARVRRARIAGARCVSSCAARCRCARFEPGGGGRALRTVFALPVGHRPGAPQPARVAA